MLTCRSSLILLPPDSIDAMFGQSACLAIKIQERRAVRSVTKYLTALVNFNSLEDPLFYETVNRIVNKYGYQIMSECLLDVGGRTPASYVPFVAQIMYVFSVCFKDLTGTWQMDLFSKPGFPSSRVTDEDKRSFALELSGTKQLGKFKEVVRLFMVKCRGSDRTDFGNVL